MATKDLKIIPYYDDYDSSKGYHRVLFGNFCFKTLCKLSGDFEEKKIPIYVDNFVFVL